ncbi:hypothetical protein NDU88_007941 [Pleurodeles waltl]|uniref:Uncharacterized protein n=1 Tax=Pleurodeles waltl TaxID=8319 RepID=A0AAV7NWD3_PLEWA|nr:hypothetical protein NDU88_007941 [Pleurodeles waltl]
MGEEKGRCLKYTGYEVQTPDWVVWASEAVGDFKRFCGQSASLVRFRASASRINVMHGTRLDTVLSSASTRISLQQVAWREVAVNGVMNVLL